jgi:hypothetical protein
LCAAALIKYRCVLGGRCPNYRVGCWGEGPLYAAALSTDMSRGAIALSKGRGVGIGGLCMQLP